MRKLLVILAVAAMASTAGAVPVMVNSEDTLPQDPLILHVECHELGVGFPVDELISASCRTTEYTPCQENPDDPSTPNVEVSIVNLTTITWSELVYVADPETTLTNDDGLVNGELAFNIDNFGKNTPLVYEDNPNLKFEPNETWKFVIQDYSNAFGLNAACLGSVGLVGNQSAGDTLSSGSIIAVPEPAAMTLLLAGALVALRRRRR